MKKLLIILLILASTVAVAFSSGCFLKDEHISELNRICIYSCPDEDCDRSLIVGACEPCPFTL